MKTITHQRQRDIWEKEHEKPFVLLQMDSKDASSGVIKFQNWLKEQNLSKDLKGIEVGCGKGRNVIWLAGQGYQMTGIDFSTAAIKEAQKRAQEANVDAEFKVHDATTPWPFNDGTFDFGIDCFATTDIESEEGRNFAVSELQRIIKPGGFVMVYLLSTEDEFHKQMIEQSPTEEKNAFLHPTTGKFEKAYDRDEIINLYSGFKLVQEERVAKKATFFEKEYNCYHHWMIFQK